VRQEPRKCGFIREVGAGKKSGGGALFLFSDLVSEVKVKNEREIGAIYRGLRRVDCQFCPR